MASIRELIEAKAKRFDTVPDKYVNAVQESQSEIFTGILSLLDQLERDSAGNIIASASNLRTVDNIVDQTKLVLNGSTYVEALNSFLQEFDKQAIINNSYFSKTFTINDRELAIQTLANAKRNASINLLGAPLDREFYEPIRITLTDSINASASLQETITAIRTITEGDEQVLGKLNRYASQIASDAFTQTDRAYTMALAEDVGAKFYRYVGGLLTDSREFCVSRNAKYYHKNEIKLWVTSKGGGLSNPTPRGKSWQGRIRTTNSSTIFIDCGGFNCKHSLLPVSILSVPKSVIDRNIQNGNFKPSEAEKRELALV
jgi:hypothetical protein